MMLAGNHYSIKYTSGDRETPPLVLKFYMRGPVRSIPLHVHPQTGIVARTTAKC